MTREEAAKTLGEIWYLPEKEADAVAMAIEALKEDVAPVKHAYWEEYGALFDGVDEYPMYRCSDCIVLNYKKSRYCPYCGAKMDKEEDK